MKTIAIALLATSLSACATTTTPDAPPMSDPQPPMAAACQAENAQSLVGQPATAANVDLARQRSNAKTVRTLKPGQMVTMEYREDRLNIDLDANGNIKGVRCG